MSAELKYTCDECEKQFSRPDSLRRHILLHASKARPYTRKKQLQCEECGKKFAQANHLKSHLRVHKDYHCKECNKTYFRKIYLQKHLLVHSDKGTFQCEECGTRFNQASHLKTHIQVHRAGKGVFRCEKCGQAFSYFGHLQYHYLQEHRSLEALARYLAVPLDSAMKVDSAKTSALAKTIVSEAEAPSSSTGVTESGSTPVSSRDPSEQPEQTEMADSQLVNSVSLFAVSGAGEGGTSEQEAEQNEAAGSQAVDSTSVSEMGGGNKTGSSGNANTAQLKGNFTVDVVVRPRTVNQIQVQEVEQNTPLAACDQPGNEIVKYTCIHMQKAGKL